MNFILRKARVAVLVAICCATLAVRAEDTDKKNRSAENKPTLATLKSSGLERSRYGQQSTESVREITSASDAEMRQADLAKFASTIKPLLEANCIDCHGPDATEGNLRIDMLDPDLVAGSNTEWWSEIFAVITKGEMPPPDYGELSDDHRVQLVDWLSVEMQKASVVQRRSDATSAFRRMTRYEYNYALQDLLGLPWDFAKDLPPESHSQEGFENSSDLLHLSVSQFETFHRIARTALERATVRGDRPPTRYWNIAMNDAARQDLAKHEEAVARIKEELKSDQELLAKRLQQLEHSFRSVGGNAYYRDLNDDSNIKADWVYYDAAYAIKSQDYAADIPKDVETVAVLPNGTGPRLIFELGNELPDEGTMRVTVRASRVDNASEYIPSLQLWFGWQASNEGRALLRVSEEDTPVEMTSEAPQTIRWDVPLGEIYPRNSVRKTSPMGGMPSPSEYIRLMNSSAEQSEIQIDFVQVAAPVYDVWPPESHRRIFFESERVASEPAYARELIHEFMVRAWRRPVSEEEVERKLTLFDAIRSDCESFEEAVIEVLAAVLSSPQFLYISNSTLEDSFVEGSGRALLDGYALANRLSAFLWCSIPDQELLELAERGQISDPVTLASQTRRLLDDPRSVRFAEHFVFQWLNMQLLEFLNFQQHQRGFDPLLKEAMQREPVEMFSEMLRDDCSVLDFIHCDYALVNERLARHYGIVGVQGNYFRRVPLNDDFQRGGLLTQAGLLAMNSDWPDSHPLKRAIWLLESLLGDPPPPPPPAVPQIDLADPEIAKMTLKERIEDHRNHAACMSCHSKIDPWGIAFENYDALGLWREELGGKPIDATSQLFNHQTLDGMEGLKRFLLQNRQDQFVRATIEKLSTFALGRPLTFADQADIDEITSKVRQNGDGLRTMVEVIVGSELFRAK